MDGRTLMFFYAAVAVAIVGVGWQLVSAIRTKRPLRVILTFALIETLIVGVSVGLLAARLAGGIALDFSHYPATARVVVVALFYSCGSLVSHTGQRRWRSTVGLDELGAAMTQGGVWEGFGPLGQVLVRVAMACVGIVMALPEVFLAR